MSQLIAPDSSRFARQSRALTMIAAIKLNNKS
jgi:hypothetical protein